MNIQLPKNTIFIRYTYNGEEPDLASVFVAEKIINDADEKGVDALTELYINKEVPTCAIHFEAFDKFHKFDIEHDVVETLIKILDEKLDSELLRSPLHFDGDLNIKRKAIALKNRQKAGTHYISREKYGALNDLEHVKYDTDNIYIFCHSELISGGKDLPPFYRTAIFENDGILYVDLNNIKNFATKIIL